MRHRDKAAQNEGPGLIAKLYRAASVAGARRKHSTGQAGQVEMHSDWLDVTNLDGATTRNANQRAILMVPFLSRHEWLSAVEKRRMPWQFVHVWAAFRNAWRPELFAFQDRGLA